MDEDGLMLVGLGRGHGHLGLWAVSFGFRVLGVLDSFFRVLGLGCKALGSEAEPWRAVGVLGLPGCRSHGR